jgi:hypothetical protein
MTERRLGALLLTACLGLGTRAMTACGPDAVGVDACRQIEQARCEAAAACGTVSDVADCQRFYRDHCLHGLAAETAPGDPAVARCVEAIQQAGLCEKEAPDTPLDACPDGAPATPFSGADVEVPCDIVERPELVQECAFLEPNGAAGAEGNAGSSGGSGGDSS